jgi:hypothetical protein
MAQNMVEAIEQFRYHWRTIKLGDKFPADAAVVRANPSKFKAAGGGGGRPEAWGPVGEPANAAERMQRWGIGTPR